MSEQNQGPDQVPESFLGPGTTGRVLVVTAPAQRIGAADQGVTTLSNVAGVSPDETSEAGEVDTEVLTNPQASVNFPDLGILVAGGLDREQADRIAAAVDNPENPLQAIVPERRYRALQEQPPRRGVGRSAAGTLRGGTCCGRTHRGASRRSGRAILEGVSGGVSGCGPKPGGKACRRGSALARRRGRPGSVRRITIYVGAAGDQNGHFAV